MFALRLPALLFLRCWDYVFLVMHFNIQVRFAQFSRMIFSYKKCTINLGKKRIFLQKTRKKVQEATSMSWVSSLYNQNVESRASAKVNVTTGGTTSFTTFHNVPNFLELDKIVAHSSASWSAGAIEVYRHGAKYNASPSADLYLGASTNATNPSAQTTPFTYTFDGLFCSDLYQANTLSVAVTGLTCTAPLDLVAYFKPAGNTGVDAIASTMQNLHARMLSGNSIGGSVNLTKIWTGMNAQSSAVELNNTVYYYVGSSRPFHGMQVLLAQEIGSKAGDAAEYRYWNGTWTLIPNLYDGTSDLQTPASSLSHSGVIAWDKPTDWVPSTMPNDPLTLKEVAINSKQTPAYSVPYNPPRYWVQIKQTTVPSPQVQVHRITTLG